ncbi:MULTISPECIES: DUF6233 domain-containing protein [unclassified Streptomyces]|uniref:DUF6233 domain-containing protein n=1 Tax=unclassified Streptomyces TaxID=2593676 RepID=UPI001E3781D6|nr:DUF6233 domain-containing protein [Streptomyces sp. CB02980]MCB8908354.1 DUF6233 domain-containing protein [Streptomyces sp. CB02980]
MSDLPPDLPRLRTLEHWLVVSLERVRHWITERAGGRPVADSVHIGDCRLAAPHRKPLSREEARRALTDGGIRACEICRPDSELGILD